MVRAVAPCVRVARPWLARAPGRFGVAAGPRGSPSWVLHGRPLAGYQAPARRWRRARTGV